MALIVAGVVAVLLAPVAGWVARRLDVVDRPGPLKVHARPVPYLGGLAVLAGVAGPVALARPVLLVPIGLAALLGLGDDVTALSARVRLAAEVAIGLSVAWVVPVRGPVGVVVTVAFVVVLVNAVNLLDGLDGLACGVGAISALGFAVVLDGDERTLALALAGALGGLLVWNRPPARIYLGDSGSYLVGTALAVLLASAWGEGEPISLGASALLLVGVPVADTGVAITRRLRAHRPLLQGDRGHIYDQLVDGGWAPTRAVGACLLAQGLLALIAIGVAELPAGGAVVLAGGVVAVVGVLVLWRFTSPARWAG